MKLCLNGIYRNEARCIERMLKSVAPYISCYVIVDTGSTDDTPNIIQKFFGERNIPGEIHRIPFVNFEQARNAALDAARSSPLDFDGMFLVDADMELRVDGTQDFPPRKPYRAGYDMRQYAGTLVYWNKRIINRAYPGRYVGVTHEYLDCPDDAQIHSAYFYDHADGSNRPEKFVRDIALLEEGLRGNISEGLRQRYTFYLAQSQRDAGRTCQAADTYKRRVALGGWDEEVWNSQLNYAHCLKDMGDEGGFLREALKAYEMRPSRAETLYDVAKYFREKGKNYSSLVFTEAGLQVPPSKDYLFVSDYAYKTGLREEFSICAFYDPKKRDKGAHVCSRLTLDLDSPEYARQGARKNLFYYLKPLVEHTHFYSSTRIPFKSEPGWTPLNPSIINVEGSLGVIVRTVNYTITDEGYYMINGKDGRIHYDNDNPIRTRNFLCGLNEKMEITTQDEIKYDNLPREKWGLVRGFEDMRVFHWKDALWTSSTVREMNERGDCQQVLARLEPQIGQYQLADIKPMSKADGRTEKNWMPMVAGDKLCFVYKLGTLVDTNGLTTEFHPTGFHVDHIRGSSQCVDFYEGYLAVTHEAGQLDNGQRYYYHRFVLMQPTGEVISLSAPFYFNNKQIEFVAGMCWHPDKKHLLISYGVKDKEAWIAKVHSTDVVEMLHEWS